MNRPLDRPIGMEILVIDWAKEEAKMAKSFVIFMFVTTNNNNYIKIFSQVHSIEGVLANNEF